MKYIFILCVSMTLLLLSCSDTTNNPPADPAAYTTANGINGGMLYDKFWAVETGFDQTNSNIASFNTFGDFYRCKQCHAWDLMGRIGSYNNRAPKTNRPNVANINLITVAKDRTAQQLFDAIKNVVAAPRRALTADLAAYDPATNNAVGDQMPDYSKILTDAQIWNIVKFLKVEALDVTQLYDAAYTGTYPSGKTTLSNVGKDGDATLGNAFFTNKCAACHGTDGKYIADLDNTPGMTVGKFARNKGFELQHKIKFGQLGSMMLATPITKTEIKNLYKALSDTTKFSN